MKSGKEIERMLDTYIQKEKAVEVDYFLKTRIMSKVSSLNENKLHLTERIKFWQIIAVAASIAIAVTVGISLGSSYPSSLSSSDKLVINDSHIENLDLFLMDEGE